MLSRTASHLADKILFYQKSVTGRRSTQPNAPVGVVPAARYRRACNSLLDFPGEQLTLGASKMMVYRLHLYSLIIPAKFIGFFRLLANYIQNE
jgi:hypothetical protein